MYVYIYPNSLNVMFSVMQISILKLKEKSLLCRVEKEDEIGSLIKGCNFLLRNIPDEQFSYDRHGDPEYRFINTEPGIFPYLLVNIGSGVSIMKVSAKKYIWCFFVHDGTVIS